MLRIQEVITTIALVGLMACESTYGTGDGSGTPPPPAAVTVAYCSGLEPEWAAFQDGDGEWTRAQPATAGGTVSFHSSLSSKRGAIATFARYGDGVTLLWVLYGTPAELATAGNTNPLDCGPFVSKTLLGTVAGLDASDVAFVGGSFNSRQRVRVDNTFEVKGFPSGPHDLLAARTTAGGAFTGFILRRDIDPPDSAALPVFDFASAEAFAPAVANLTINGLGAEGAASGTRLLTSHDEISATLLTNTTTDVTRGYVAMPETQLRAGDLQILTASASAINGSARSATVYFRAPTDRTLTLGAPLIPPTFTTVATAPALRLRAQFATQSDYDRSAVISYQQGATTLVAITMTAAYAALSGGYDLLLPDLSGVAGFDPAWTLHPGGRLWWTAGQFGGTLGLGRNAVPTDGTTQWSASMADSIPAQ